MKCQNKNSKIPSFRTTRLSPGGYVKYIEKIDDARPRLDIVNAETFFDQNILIHEFSAIRSKRLDIYHVKYSFRPALKSKIVLRFS